MQTRNPLWMYNEKDSTMGISTSYNNKIIKWLYMTTLLVSISAHYNGRSLTRDTLTDRLK